MSIVDQVSCLRCLLRLEAILGTIERGDLEPLLDDGDLDAFKAEMVAAFATGDEVSHVMIDRLNEAMRHFEGAYVVQADTVRDYKRAVWRGSLSYMGPYRTRAGNNRIDIEDIDVIEVLATGLAFYGEVFGAVLLDVGEGIAVHIDMCEAEYVAERCLDYYALEDARKAAVSTRN